MLNKVKSFAEFVLAFVRQFKTVSRQHGLRYGKAFAECWWIDWHIHRQEKRGRCRVECPICGWTGYDFRMLNCGWFSVPHVECPQCFSHERHRMLHLYLKQEQPDFFTEPGTVLHFAPERHVSDLIEQNPRLKCFATDYARHMIAHCPGTAFQADMMNIPLKDNSIDLLFCLHVLEHVPDDRRGIIEMHRVLSSGGVAFIMVPFMMGWKKSEEFGEPDPQWFDHVRGYAPGDFADRLDVFQYDAILPDSFLSREDCLKYRIPNSQVIYRCTKQGPSS